MYAGIERERERRGERERERCYIIYICAGRDHFFENTCKLIYAGVAWQM